MGILRFAHPTIYRSQHPWRESIPNRVISLVSLNPLIHMKLAPLDISYFHNTH